MKKSKVITGGFIFLNLAISLMSYTTKTEKTTYVEESKIEILKGEELFKAKCALCHTTSRPDDMSKLIAPPIMGVMMHVKNGVKGKDKIEKRKNAIDFIVDYVQNPSAEKSMLEPHAIERFKVMPSQKENVTPEEIVVIANYLYDNFPPKGMTHDKMHKGNKKGSCGKGCGGSCKH